MYNIGLFCSNLAIWIGIKVLPSRPFPSEYAWIVSNCAWDNATLIKYGSTNSSFIYSYKFSNNPYTFSGAGGINIALSILAPLGPIQFWVVRIWPGFFLEPRTLSNKSLCIVFTNSKSIFFPVIIFSYAYSTVFFKFWISLLSSVSSIYFK